MFMEGQCFSISVQSRTRTSPHVLTCLYACLALHGYGIAPSGCTPQPALNSQKVVGLSDGKSCTAQVCLMALLIFTYGTYSEIFTWAS